MTIGRAPCVIVTEGEGAGLRLAARLRQSGADVRMLPVITHSTSPDLAALDAALSSLDGYSWVGFTSARAVEAVCGHPAWTRIEWSGPMRPRVGAVGPMTAAALLAHGVEVDLRPAVPGGRALAEAIVAAEAGSMPGRTVLWPRSDIADPRFAEVLTAAGATVVMPVAYCTRANRPEGFERLAIDVAAGRIDAVAFLSPSAAANLATLMPGGTLVCLNGATLVASVGPATSAALAALGAPAGLEAPARTAGDLAAALLSYLGLSGRPDP
jgi:uroporphyrinogen-III synthase